jgi:hypothetical protein
VEIAGAFFTFAGDEAIEASTWTSIVTGTTAYIVLTASGTAGSQIVAATYTSTAPTWRDDLQGWYASAASSARVVGSVYKAEATSYYPKYLLASDQVSSFPGVFKISGTLSVASSLTVGGGASVGGGVTAGGLLSGTGLVMYNYIHSTLTNENAVFDALSPSIPATGNTIIISGGYSDYALARAYRNSSTEIILYGVKSGALLSYTINDGSASVVNDMSIAW